MSFLLLAVGAAFVAYQLGKSWTILIPLVIGGVTAAAVVAVDGSLSDTPIPFAVAVATIGAVLGLVIQRQRPSLFRT